jgi:O-antigen/teichoic acid export membrane protein
VNKTKTNILANLGGRSICAILSIVFVPVYLSYLGVEAYGLVGFFLSIQAFLVLLDSGITPTLNREVSRLSCFPHRFQQLRDLSRTLEILCWFLAVVACAIALIICPLAGDYWFRSTTLQPDVITGSLSIMSVTLVFQWAIGFYSGGLLGLEEQRVLNIVNVTATLIRSIGTLVVLAYISPTLGAFLVCQLISTSLQAFCLGIVFWKRLPRPRRRAHFSFTLLKPIWGYSSGVAATAVVTLVLTQTDKLILSKMLSLEGFGYYSLAVTLAGAAIGIIVGSIQSVYFPQFSQLVVQDREAELPHLYHRACQVMSFFLLPGACTLIFFSHPILLVWTGSAEIADNAYLLLSVVAIGTTINGLMHLPYVAQLAVGITRLGFWQNLISIFFLIPLMIYGTARFGALGGALGWVILNLSQICVGIPIMHRIIMAGEGKRWLFVDVGIPIVTAVGINSLAWLVVHEGLITLPSRTQAVLYIGTTLLITFGLSLFSTPTSRYFVFERLLPRLKNVEWFRA